jgi:23S rRNA (adenine2030-N6)-methyltransferase
MNYRHAYHAGNFADVFKHVALTRILAYLTRKEAPLRYMDSHAGIGRYDLHGSEAERSGEWRDGVARFKDARPTAEVGALLSPYLQALGPLDAEGRPAAYPGSPALAQALLRSQDRLALCELHPEDRAKLVANMGRDHRLTIVPIDGYVAVNAWLPPKEKRGLVLIDPPFEETNEAERIIETLRRAHSKWPGGTYVLWRPIKEAREDGRFLNAFKALGVSDMLQLSLDVGAPPKRSAAGDPLRRTGLVIINPPHVFESEMRTLLLFLATLLAREGGGEWICEWLTEPT